VIETLRFVIKATRVLLGADRNPSFDARTCEDAMTPETIYALLSEEVYLRSSKNAGLAIGGRASGSAPWKRGALRA
jgi:hypothetical protein